MSKPTNEAENGQFQGDIAQGGILEILRDEAGQQQHYSPAEDCRSDHNACSDNKNSTSPGEPLAR